MPPRLPLIALARPAQLIRPVQTRSISWFGWGKKKSDIDAANAPSTSSERDISALLKASPRTSQPKTKGPVMGSLNEDSIFGVEDEGAPAAVSGNDIDLSVVAQFRDSRREAWSWPKRYAAREHRRRGRLTRTEEIKRTEKEHTAKSHMFKTSYKKLMMLARQCQGKSITDAIVQMKFSPKKAAKDVLGHLEHARNEAIVRLDMKPEDMYISEAWVGRGTYEREANHRARGRIDMMRPPYTSITVVLKETATLKRIAKEKEAKRLRKPVKEVLPQRPINGQRQYYLW